MSTDQLPVKVSVQLVPAFHIYLTYTLHPHVGTKKKVGYTEPKTTDQLVVEIPYGESREYRLPQTTGGY